MSFAEFQHHALLWVLGSVDEDEMVEFEEGRREYGEAGERFIHDCQKLHSMLALSLPPKKPRAAAREELLRLVKASMESEPGR